LKQRTVQILLVEDNPADVRLTAEAFRESQVEHSLHVAADGVEAMAYLRREAPHESAVRPDLVILDLNLPRKDGREVLAEIKSDPGLKRIPVLVLTTSQADADVAQCYDLHANCVLSKPLQFDRFLASVERLRDFWLGAVTLPPH
jgi:CheY-like chemotaxis protein